MKTVVEGRTWTGTSLGRVLWYLYEAYPWRVRGPQEEGSVGRRVVQMEP